MPKVLTDDGETFARDDLVNLNSEGEVVSSREFCVIYRALVLLKMLYLDGCTNAQNFIYKDLLLDMNMLCYFSDSMIDISYASVIHD